MASVTFHVDVHEEDDGSLWSEVAELPGCFASGFTLEELQEATIEAIGLCLPDGVVLGEATWGPPEDGKRKGARPGASKGKRKKRRLLVTA